MILEDINKKYKQEFENLAPKIKETSLKFYANLGNCSCILFVFREKRENPPTYQGFNDIAGISAAIENLMISAVSEGLGTCWVGTFKDYEKQISKIVNAPKDQELMTSVLIGYPKKGYKPLKRDKKKLKDILRFI